MLITPFSEFDAALPRTMSEEAKVELFGSSRSEAAVRSAERILAVPAASIVMPAGTGRSILFSTILHRAARRLVYHVFPDPVLPVEAKRFVTELFCQSSVSSPPLALANWPGDGWHTEGVVYVSATVMLAQIERTAGKCLSGAIVLVDESGRADDVTADVARLSRQYKASRYIITSAVRATARDVSVEVGPSTSTHVSVAQPMCEWRSDDVDKPWAASGTQGNFLFFTDCAQTRRKLSADYGSLPGWRVFDLPVGSDRGQVEAAMSSLSGSGDRVLLLVGTAFRSGFSFRVDRIFDCGVSTVKSVTEQFVTTEVPASRRELCLAAARSAYNVCGFWVATPGRDDAPAAQFFEPFSDVSREERVGRPVYLDGPKHIPSIDVLGKLFARSLFAEADESSRHVNQPNRLPSVARGDIARHVLRVEPMDELEQLQFSEVAHSGCVDWPRIVEAWCNRLFEPGGGVVQFGMLCIPPGRPGKMRLNVDGLGRVALQDAAESFDSGAHSSTHFPHELEAACILHNVAVVELSAAKHAWETVCLAYGERRYVETFPSYCEEFFLHALRVYTLAVQMRRLLACYAAYGHNPYAKRLSSGFLSARASVYQAQIVSFMS